MRIERLKKTVEQYMRHHKIGHLKEETVALILETGSVAPILIQFFGSRTGFAGALNDSKNPLKALVSMLNKTDDEGNLKNQLAYARYLKKIEDGPTKEELEPVTVPDEVQEMTLKFYRKMKVGEDEPENNFDDIAAFHNDMSEGDD